MDDIFNQYGMQLAKCMEVIDNLAARFEARKTQPDTTLGPPPIPAPSHVMPTNSHAWHDEFLIKHDEHTTDTDGMVKRSSYTCEIIRIVLWSALNYCEPNSKVLDLGIGIFKTDSVPYILCADNIIPTPSVLLLSRRWNSNHGLIQDQSEGVDGWSQTFYTRGHPLLN
uniref:Uncharacterized protein n=1 Tax=Oryza barthii TaxID=65489 RepID=A0A0D3GPS5_9ORYZ